MVLAALGNVKSQAFTRRNNKVPEKAEKKEYYLCPSVSVL
jgi:hypothetical protein